jgi:hypothetical protein
MFHFEVYIYGLILYEPIKMLQCWILLETLYIRIRFFVQSI